jgi:hypothetical protein
LQSETGVELQMIDTCFNTFNNHLQVSIISLKLNVSLALMQKRGCLSEERETGILNQENFTRDS